MRAFLNLLLTCCTLAASLLATAASARPNDTITLPLSTRAEKIIDAKGTPVVLRGVAWFGMETETHVPHGLWARDYKDMLRQIRDSGFNLVRLPFSLKALQSSRINGVQFELGGNQELQGKTPLEVMDRIVAEADRCGLMILLDCHRLNDSQIPELWYGDGYTERDWIDAWRLLARRYRRQANVIGADLKNEPHGRASWGTGDAATDWRLAAERAGNALHEICPHWLIVVEGVEKNVPGQTLAAHWWGGNLEGVREARPGWLTLDVPPLEHWEEPIKWLTPEQKTRLESAEFYELLQREVARRFLHAGEKRQVT